MSVLSIQMYRGQTPLLMKLDLDEQLPNERTILNFVRQGHYYEPDISRVLIQVVGEGDTVIDVGANIGFFSTLAATLAGPTGRVVSFEPDPANRARLTNNLAINGYSNGTVVESPASDKSGMVEFYLNSDDSGGNALWDPAQFPGNVRSQAEKRIMRVRATTLDEEMTRLGLPTPKLIKVDTEGADQRVLEGARKLLTGAGVPFVISELHGFGLQKMGCTPESLRGYMEGLGYSTFAIFYDGRLPHLVPRGTTVSGGKYIINLLFSTPEQVGRYWKTLIVDPRRTGG